MSSILLELTKIVGEKFLLTKDVDKRPYLKGYRSGYGNALAVAIPANLVEQYQCFKLAVENNLIVLMQGANTGVTGGSTPYESYDRDLIIISTLRINNIFLLNEASEFIALSGATLYELEEKLEPFGRDPHSVLGSSSIGATIIGGIANNSGGALIKRGPAYTQMALYARVNELGRVELINHLHIPLGNTELEILKNLQERNFDPNPPKGNHEEGRKGSDYEYESILRDTKSKSPTRFNSNPRELYEASGSAGHLCIFAVRLDSFPKPKETNIFYIGSNSQKELLELRTKILEEWESLPLSVEYMNRESFEISNKYGKWSFKCIEMLGTKRLLKLFNLKRKIESNLQKLNINYPVIDTSLYYLFKLFPKHLPKRILEFGEKYNHHLIINTADNINEAEIFLNDFFKDRESSFFKATKEEGKKAMLNRFASAGAGMQYCLMHRDSIEGLLDLDIAMPRNEPDFLDHLGEELDDKIAINICCGHFMCMVFHRDYLIKKGFDIKETKAKIVKVLENRGAKCPAEHNCGHMYEASANQVAFYKQLDPTNSLNPGIGKTSKLKYWA